jgi:thioredoxin 1
LLKDITVLVLGQVLKLVNLLASGLDIITVPKRENNMIKITDMKAFTDKILSGSGLQIVRFCTEWSGPCQMMAPIYHEMFSMYKKSASFYRIDIDEAPLLKKEFGITELPTILFYKNGTVIDFAVGLISREALIEKMGKLVG